jgi:hypothetical protein
MPDTPRAVRQLVGKKIIRSAANVLTPGCGPGWQAALEGARQTMTAIGEDGYSVEVTIFDYGALDPHEESEDEEFWRIQGELLGEILRWLTVPQKPAAVGQRVLALCLYLNPDLIEQDSLRKISKACKDGVTAAALSHSLREFQDQFQAHRGAFQKAEHLRGIYSRSRVASHQSRQVSQTT